MVKQYEICGRCGGTGRVSLVSDEELHAARDAARAYCADEGIHAGTERYDEILSEVERLERVVLERDILDRVY